MNWVLIYLLIGLCNAAQFQIRRPWYFMWEELIFNIFFWPLQVIFRLLVWMVTAVESILGWNSR